jgi:hypothetical protein
MSTDQKYMIIYEIARYQVYTEYPYATILKETEEMKKYVKNEEDTILLNAIIRVCNDKISYIARKSMEPYLLDILESKRTLCHREDCKLTKKIEKTMEEIRMQEQRPMEYILKIGKICSTEEKIRISGIMALNLLQNRETEKICETTQKILLDIYIYCSTK